MRMATKLLLACQRGFWLTKNIFMKCESAEVVMAERKDLLLNEIVKKPMLVLSDVVELTIDRNGKILAVEQHPRYGLWRDAVEHAMKLTKRKVRKCE